MNRDEKTAVVEEIASQLEASEAVFAIDYRGISVPQAAELRTKLRDSDSSFRVSKNRLAKLAADKAGRSDLNEFLVGPTALTFVKGDTAAAAKTITSFSKEHNVLAFKGGYMGETLLDEPRFKAIAVLPSRDVLNAQLVSMVAQPIIGVVRGLNALIQGLVTQLGQIADQGLVTGEAPAPEPEAEAAPVEETPAAEEKPAEDAAAAPESNPTDTPGSEAEDVSADETAEDVSADDAEEPAAEEPEASDK